jgi:predicted NBD/HSP70 family sugar kinase
MFVPMSLAVRDIIRRGSASSEATEIRIGVRAKDRLKTFVMPFPGKDLEKETDTSLVERIVKTLLWLYGGHIIVIDGPAHVTGHVKDTYRKQGARDFDVTFMEHVYDAPFSVIVTHDDNALIPSDRKHAQGRHLEGCRIGFDAGGSDHKVSAVIDGKVVWSEETVWHPKTQRDPSYHLEHITHALMKAASHLPRVDSVGISSAGIHMDNRTRVASLFMSVPETERHQIDSIWKDAVLRAVGNVPFVVQNDGDVTALAGAMALDKTNILGIAMGTSEAAGFIDRSGSVTGWLNELAFVPVDFGPDGAADEWSDDVGCGVKYLSQDAVSRLAEHKGIAFEASLTPAEKLRQIQDLAQSGDPIALEIFDSIGFYLGHAVLYYHMFYAMETVLVLGRVTSGIGGERLVRKARQVIESEDPRLAGTLDIILPDEQSRRVGQSVAAASMPAYGGDL